MRLYKTKFAHFLVCMLQCLHQALHSSDKGPSVPALVAVRFTHQCIRHHTFIHSVRSSDTISLFGKGLPLEYFKMKAMLIN